MQILNTTLVLNKILGKPRRIKILYPAAIYEQRYRLTYKALVRDITDMKILNERRRVNRYRGDRVYTLSPVQMTYGKILYHRFSLNPNEREVTLRPSHMRLLLGKPIGLGRVDIVKHNCVKAARKLAGIIFCKAYAVLIISAENVGYSYVLYPLIYC